MHRHLVDPDPETYAARESRLLLERLEAEAKRVNRLITESAVFCTLGGLEVTPDARVDDDGVLRVSLNVTAEAEGVSAGHLLAELQHQLIGIGRVIPIAINKNKTAA